MPKKGIQKERKKQLKNTIALYINPGSLLF